MEFYIKPTLYLVDQKFWTLSGELNDLSLAELQDIIDSCFYVINNEGQELYWGWHISSLEMRKEITILSYNKQIIAKIPTTELYNMLKAYRDKLDDYENEQRNV